MGQDKVNAWLSSEVRREVIYLGMFLSLFGRIYYVRDICTLMMAEWEIKIEFRL